MYELLWKLYLRVNVFNRKHLNPYTSLSPRKRAEFRGMFKETGARRALNDVQVLIIRKRDRFVCEALNATVLDEYTRKALQDHISFTQDVLTLKSWSVDHRVLFKPKISRVLWLQSMIDDLE